MPLVTYGRELTILIRAEGDPSKNDGPPEVRKIAKAIKDALPIGACVIRETDTHRR